MKTYRNSLMAIAAIALATIGVAVPPASSQGQFVAAGKFTLPYEVKWQNATLPAGDYTFRMQSASLPAIVELQGENANVRIMAMAIDQKQIGEQSSITIEWRGNTGFVHELNLAQMNLQFLYATPKSSKSERLLAQAPPRTDHILISSLGK
jgi:hypothetical protein